MLFNSIVFLIFAVIFFSAWPFLAPRRTSRWIFICIASFIFYGWWDWRYLPLMLATALVDFFAGLAMQRFPLRRKQILIISLTSNLGVLCGFKYFGFFADSLNHVLRLSGASFSLPVLDLMLPLGISFYTFHSMSYSIDVYHEELTPTKNVLHYLAFISMFPMLVAGPIVRGRQVLPQLETWERPNMKKIWDGLRLLASGYFKKMVIADNIAVAVNRAFESGQAGKGSMYWWIVAALFLTQIYCDFSGYSDIARGLANWMGYDLPLNFNHPFFLAKNLRQFWSRWHISLATWFRDYVYFPLDWASRGEAPHRSLLITMALMGLWHGAAWTFVLFGLLHGVFLTIERMTHWPERLAKLPLGTVAGWAIMISQVLVSAVLFRARTVSEAGSVLRQMFSLVQTNWSAVAALGALPLGVASAAVALELNESFVHPHIAETNVYRALEPAVIAIMLVAAIFLRGPGNQFIYFQF